MLRADGYYIVGSGEPWNWQLKGVTTSDFIYSAFETLARRGAAEIASAGIPDLLVFWLEALRQDGSGFRFTGSGSEPTGDGSDKLHYLGGCIDRLCEVSARFCKKLEARALQTEFEAKQSGKTTLPEKESAPPESEPGELAIQSVSVGQNEEIERRRKLLAEYKAATKNSSNKRIYEARNSGVHKPEFYQWLNGTLPTESATTISFERFLREKKPPIPRKPKG